MAKRSDRGSLILMRYWGKPWAKPEGEMSGGLAIHHQGQQQRLAPMLHQQAGYKDAVDPSCQSLQNSTCHMGGVHISSAGADGSGLALSERSEFSQTPAAPSNAAYP